MPCLINFLSSDIYAGFEQNDRDMERGGIKQALKVLKDQIHVVHDLTLDQRIQILRLGLTDRYVCILFNAEYLLSFLTLF